jgi:hypothetical protein
MKGWIRRTCAGCVVALALGAPLAHADEGAITFSGAVVAPTCAVSSGHMAAAAAQRWIPMSQQRWGCGDSPATGTRATPSSYTLTVEPLESSTLMADRLVNYFSSYVKAAVQEDAHMSLVTQAYE